MKPAHCDYEQEVEQAVSSDAWSESLRSHAAHCALCSEVALVAGFLRSEAALACAEAVLPDPNRIWWKAQLAAKRAAAERVVRPIALMEQLAWACAALLCGVAFLWLRPRITVWFGEVSLLWTHRAATGAAAPTLPFVVAACVFLALPVLLFGLHISWSEE
jgi:hypothetical protein